jgi:hypothetical protein
MNVLRTIFIWTELSCPIPPKSVIEVGRVVRRTKKKTINDAKYKVPPNPPLFFGDSRSPILI